ncbi:MAG: hypothetical protein NVS4B12_25820 [Ktedonobacteraceae bacterium]
MEAQEAFRLRKETFGKLCMHRAIEKEYEQGVETKEWVCSECGTEFVSKEVWAKIRRNQPQSIPS